MTDLIRIRGARQHNLKNVDVDIPREKLVVITGVSGSGKSSLAFNTLYAEGQRRYVESLSAYARQFLDQLEKPDVDRIDGLTPAIAIEQRASAPNPRSTVATTTEIYDYLRILYAAAGVPHDPATGEAVEKKSSGQIASGILSLPEGARIMVLAPLTDGEKGIGKALFAKLQKEGFVRIRVDGEIYELEDPPALSKSKAHRIDVVIDRLVVRDGVRARLFDSLETALKWGRRRVTVLIQKKGDDGWEERPMTTTFTNPATGFTLPDLTPRHFSFNSHEGACPACHGLGTQLECEPALMVPDPEKSIGGGAIKTWWARNKKLKVVQDRGILSLAKHFGVDLEAPFRSLGEDFKEALFWGTGEKAVPTGWKVGANVKSVAKPFEGLAGQALRLHETSPSEVTRRNVRRFMVPKACPKCGGRRLRKEMLAVTLTSPNGVGGAVAEELDIESVTRLPVAKAREWILGVALPDQVRAACGDVLAEIGKRLRFLEDVGLGYLSLDRESGTLSGGEAQRIRLASQIGGGLAGVLYVLDEPSIGLHQSDNDRLIETLKRLRDLGNTVVVVEHDEDTIRSADFVLDLGPDAGERGGELIAAGTPDEIAAHPESPTGRFLSGRHQIAVPKSRMSPPPRPGLLEKMESDVLDTGWLVVQGAKENNLAGIDVAFPAGCLTCVTGVSGSGKSTLIDTILRRALFRHFFRSKDAPGAHGGIVGLAQFDKAVVIDQSAIGRSPRSNPATYVGAFTPIRELFAKLPSSKVRGYGAGRFSFNVAGGRCEKCQGDGLLKIDMHFLSDVYVTCDECGGHRYNSETLEVTFKGKNIAEVLEMGIEEAARFFDKVPGIFDKLRALNEVGLGYLKLGQAATTLSGGEAQRVKLATELSKRSTGRTIYLLDEPTTGLHFSDIQRLLGVLMRLRESGNTLIVIEHNLDVIKSADWVIDLGPGGGEEGGRVVVEGTPEAVAASVESLTGRYLARMLG